jgi:hypothetical protein
MVMINPVEVKELRAGGMPIRDIAEKLGTKRRYIEEILQEVPLTAADAPKLGEEKPLAAQPVTTGKPKAKKVTKKKK